jgi:hypothetical protein
VTVVDGTENALLWRQRHGRRGAARDHQRTLAETLIPGSGIEVQQANDGRTADLDAAFQPSLPADVAAWDESALSVNDEELGMHDAERQEEECLDLQLDASVTEDFSRGQA